MEVEKVNEDQRGEIWKIVTPQKEVFLAFTKKGKARGGDIHRGEQYTFILEGKMRILSKFPDKEKEEIIEEGNLAVIPPEIPHVFVALEDSVFLEWHECPLPPYSKKRFYLPYRKICKGEDLEKKEERN